MLRIFHTHPARTSLLQDFAFYEVCCRDIQYLTHFTDWGKSVASDAEGAGRAVGHILSRPKLHAIIQHALPFTFACCISKSASIRNVQPDCLSLCCSTNESSPDEHADGHEYEPDVTDADELVHDGEYGQFCKSSHDAERHATSQSRSDAGDGQSELHGHGWDAWLLIAAAVRFAVTLKGGRNSVDNK